MKQLALLLLLSLLSACASFPCNKSAKEAFLDASFNTLLHKPYNFHTTAKFTNLSEFSNMDLKKMLEPSDTTNKNNKHNKRKILNKKLDRIFKIIENGFVSENFGTYDPKQGILEYKTGIKFEQHNINASIYFPFALNWKEKTAFLGPNILNFLLLPESSDQNKQGLLFQFSDIPKKYRGAINKYIERFIPVLFENLKKEYYNVDANQFKYQKMNADDKQYNARTKIHFSFSLRHLISILEKSLNGSINDLRHTYNNTNNPSEKNSILNLQDIARLEALAGVFSMFKQFENDDVLNTFFNSNISGDIYLDFFGRPKHLVSKFTINLDSTITFMQSHTQFSNFGSPKFEFNNSNIEYINGIEAIKRLNPLNMEMLEDALGTLPET